ncbi:MAG: hypothetical protein IJX76_05620 [Clostridia bacterium]|nr:hypothetical protein [Clostridia bacterium]
MNEIDLLNRMRQNLEMGIDGIKKVIPYAQNEGFKEALNRQLTEYQGLYRESDDLLAKHQGEPKDVPVMAKISTEVMSTMKAMAYKEDSKIAEDMVRGTATGIAKLIRHQGEYGGSDKEVNDLCTRIIQAEEKNSEEMKQYL